MAKKRMAILIKECIYSIAVYLEPLLQASAGRINLPSLSYILYNVSLEKYQ
jgi:hypothetical protein